MCVCIFYREIWWWWWWWWWSTYREAIERGKRIDHSNHRNCILLTYTAFWFGNQVDQLNQCAVLINKKKKKKNCHHHHHPCHYCYYPTWIHIFAKEESSTISRKRFKKTSFRIYTSTNWGKTAYINHNRKDRALFNFSTMRKGYKMAIH